MVIFHDGLEPRLLWWCLEVSMVQWCGGFSAMAGDKGRRVVVCT